ncbi:MAG: hypothetical protein GC192_22155 [Bacteroidetes bacterium]|nr:hypothetical protein [Bacteroidota bacterium]
MQFYPNNMVVRQAQSQAMPVAGAELTPNIYITIAVDVAYVISQQGQSISKGIYLMDNMIANGSMGEGTMEITTIGNAGQVVGWNIVPINPYLNNQTVEITFIQICLGTVFGSPPVQADGNGFSWVAQLIYSGKQAYAIQIKVTEGLTPVSYYVNWEAIMVSI